MKLKNNLCTKWDDWLEDRDCPVWVAELSDGSLVYQDDGRPGFSISAWERLMLSGEKLVGLSARFRDHWVHMPKNMAGYYFIKSILAGPFMERPHHFYILGYLLDGVIKCTKYKVPELEIDEVFDRAPEDGGFTDYGNILICNS